MAPVPRCVVAMVLALCLGWSACSDGGDADEQAQGTTASTASTTTAPPCPSPGNPLRVVLVNDDGVENPAIDAMVDVLEGMGGIELTVIAPAEERSGSSDTTTPGGAAFVEAITPGGREAYAVDGFPADAVAVALDDLQLDPHLFVSGVNPGQNVGPLASVSGTVGVGRTAVRRGYPALAVSAGVAFDEAQFAFGADLAGEWIEEHCASLVAGAAQADTVTSINIPQCPVDAMGDLVEVPRAPELAEGEDVFQSSCDQADPDPATDVAAIRSGHPAITQVPADLPEG